MWQHKPFLSLLATESNGSILINTIMGLCVTLQGGFCDLQASHNIVFVFFPIFFYGFMFYFELDGW